MRDAFIVIGAGGHGRVVAETVAACGWRVVGFADGDASLVGTCLYPDGVPVIADVETLFADFDGIAALASIEDPESLAFALGVGDNDARLALFDKMGDRPLPPVVHPTAHLSLSATIGMGSVVLPGAVVHTDAKIGRAVIVNTGAVVEHDCILEDGAHLSPNATLAGGVRVGRGTWIGAGATVIEGLEIGVGALVGAGAVVIRDVADGCRMVGVPARVLP